MSGLSSFRSAGFLEVFNLAPPGITAAVGAGGKSTLLGRFAGELRARGETGLLSVTTKLKQSQGKLGDALIRVGDDTALPMLSAYACRVPLLIRRPLPELEKLEGVAPELICRIGREYPELPILVEADGAAEGWLKVPGAHEPQIPSCARTVIALTAFPVLGASLETAKVHRRDELVRVCGKAEGLRFSPEVAARLLNDPSGSFKGAPPGARRIWFINQADDEDERDRAISFVESLLGLPSPSPGVRLYDRIVVGSLRTGEFIYTDLPQDREQ